MPCRTAQFGRNSNSGRTEAMAPPTCTMKMASSVPKWLLRMPTMGDCNPTAIPAPNTDEAMNTGGSTPPSLPCHEALDAGALRVINFDSVQVF